MTYNKCKLSHENIQLKCAISNLIALKIHNELINKKGFGHLQLSECSFTSALFLVNYYYLFFLAISQGLLSHDKNIF